jgi:hypothetical protein
MKNRKRATIDLEFTGLHKLTTPISIAICVEDGKEFYAEFTDFDKEQLNEFLENKVLSQLILGDYDFERDYDPEADLVLVKGNTQMVRNALFEFFRNYQEDEIEMWGDVNHYDWVLFISLFGTAFDKPNQVNYIPHDLATFFRVAGVDPDIDRHEFSEVEKLENATVHNSLYDARLIKSCVDKLFELMGGANKKKDSEDVSENTEETIQANDELPKPTNQTTVNEPSQKDDGFVPPSQEMINHGGEEFIPEI